MNKYAIIDSLTVNYNSFIDYINGLTAEAYAYSDQQKWTAGQQLEHMDKAAIAQNFGMSHKPGDTYEGLLNNYLEKLRAGGKAPDRYVPETTLTHQRAFLSETLTKMIRVLCAEIEHFEEQDLDRLLIPHPLLGNLTMREMLYNAIYHVQHHHALARQNLSGAESGTKKYI